MEKAIGRKNCRFDYEDGIMVTINKESSVRKSLTERAKLYVEARHNSANKAASEIL